MKKLIKNLGLPIEKIDGCRNGCMLYWKDDVGLEYCKFCEDTRYKPSLERDPHRKKSPYAVLRYLPLTPHLERLYSSRPRNVRRGLCALGAKSSSQVLARPWDAPPPPMPLLPPQAQRHHISLQDARFLTGGTATMRACSRSSSRRPRSSCGSVCRCSHPVGQTAMADRGHLAPASGVLVNQMEVFEKVYKKKDDGRWSGPRAEEVAIRTGPIV
ncbi:hypothetical protein Sango_1915500 [Sesamum angolense]|uniref:Uncharacterized protein n=1 Tax=Sesamum angolense TaxID=2727404 RepID=A0AAE1WDP8_9LAMI|nr:hypothetical protein Sango_1915500 [Sesamum angolense]